MVRKNDYKLGVCPIGKVLFSHKDTLRQKEEMYKKLDEMNIPYVSIEDVIEDGLICSMDQVEPAVEALRAKGADALFIPHCNYGTESAAGLIAKKLGLPTLLWAPRDEMPIADGSRLRDSLCGCFATSRVLLSLGVNFEYIVNCSVDDSKFTSGIDRFVRASRAAKMVRTARIGQIGMRIPFFWCTINDEAQLLNKFGVQIEPFDLVEILKATDKKVAADAEIYKQELKNMDWLDRSNIDTDEGLIKSLAMRDVLFELADKFKIDAFAVQNFDSMLEYLGAGAGVGLAMIEEKIPCSAETDIYGSLSSIIIEAVEGGDLPSFFPEYTIRHPENENAVLMWHASAAPSLRHPESGKVRVLAPSILTTYPPVSVQFFLKEGDMTACRFDGLNGKFALGAGEGRSIKGPKTREVYTWMEVDDWAQWERKLIEGPFIHHSACVYGKYADAMQLVAKFLGVDFVRFDK